MCRGYVGSLPPGEDCFHRENDHVVGEVCEDGSEQPMVEHEVEQVHTQKPRVDPTKPPLVFVPVSERCVAIKHGSAYQPTTGMENPPFEHTECREVCYVSPHVYMEYLREAHTEDESSQ